jgi:rod shape-determining protein MreD
MKKILVIIGFSLLSILLQVVFGSWLTICGIKPDFVLILVLFMAILNGRVFGQLFGFGMGLLMDIIGMGSFMGLSALSKTVAGFLAGYFKNHRNRINRLMFYGLNLLIIFIQFTIVYLINFKSTEMGTQYLFLRYIIPETVYTGLIFILLDYIFLLESF